MKINRASLLGAGFAVLSFATAAALYRRLPQVMPAHWNASGRADGFVSKPLGPFILPLVTAGAYLLFLIIPRISPRDYSIERFRRVFDVMQAATTGLLFLVTALVLLAGAGAPVPIARVVPAALGLFFAVLGNFTGKVTRNFFVGFRTPWTLANDEVWLRTHRLGGRLFVLSGLALLAAGLAGAALLPAIGAVVAAGLVPLVYSYLLHRRLDREAAAGQPR
jgi:uncharacterized membrane protein